mmetsp:Transcript_14159/g.35133  ORF Transcript_14159/g.35133 Transcript_14159/m.35133 type:complete len:1185 (-) Transcript_14159:605-4159(-)|eukprot:CAMPEP_0179009810 /NCGR_PEP_ID=MMETSP0795-20121207/16469_1 /TAXON_ID=88552 /ORGANISM="Amoebophrya sp., Strain Ameob2" /LENGTH=1184 /DNA_ID=CAMNT_0020705029 /DNA_START=79 /DNA_END=3633 /DNA_ORIENTATION=-
MPSSATSFAAERYSLDFADRCIQSSSSTSCRGRTRSPIVLANPNTSSKLIDYELDTLPAILSVFELAVSDSGTRTCSGDSLSRVLGSHLRRQPEQVQRILRDCRSLVHLHLSSSLVVENITSGTSSSATAVILSSTERNENAGNGNPIPTNRGISPLTACSSGGGSSRSAPTAAPPSSAGMEVVHFLSYWRAMDRFFQHRTGNEFRPGMSQIAFFHVLRNNILAAVRGNNATVETAAILRWLDAISEIEAGSQQPIVGKHKHRQGYWARLRKRFVTKQESVSICAVSYLIEEEIRAVVSSQKKKAERMTGAQSCSREMPSDGGVSSADAQAAVLQRQAEAQQREFNDALEGLEGQKSEIARLEGLLRTKHGQFLNKEREALLFQEQKKALAEQANKAEDDAHALRKRLRSEQAASERRETENSALIEKLRARLEALVNLEKENKNGAGADRADVVGDEQSCWQRKLEAALTEKKALESALEHDAKAASLEAHRLRADADASRSIAEDLRQLLHVKEREVEQLRGRFSSLEVRCEEERAETARACERRVLRVTKEKEEEISDLQKQNARLTERLHDMKAIDITTTKQNALGDELQRQLDERDRQLKAVRRNLGFRDGEIGDLTRQVQELAAKLELAAERSGLLEEEKRQLEEDKLCAEAAAQKELGRLLQQNQELQNDARTSTSEKSQQVESHKRQRQELEAEGEKLRAEAERREEKVAKLESRIERLKGEQASQDDLLRRKEDALNSQDAEIARIKKDHETLVKTLRKESEGKLEERETRLQNRLSELENRLETKDREAKDLLNVVAAKEQELRTAATNLDEAAKSSASLAASHESQISALQQQLRSYDQEKEQKAREVAGLKARTDEETLHVKEQLFTAQEELKRARGEVEVLKLDANEIVLLKKKLRHREEEIAALKRIAEQEAKRLEIDLAGRQQEFQALMPQATPSVNGYNPETYDEKHHHAAGIRGGSSKLQGMKQATSNSGAVLNTLVAGAGGGGNANANRPGGDRRNSNPKAAGSKTPVGGTRTPGGGGGTRTPGGTSVIFSARNKNNYGAGDNYNYELYDDARSLTSLATSVPSEAHVGFLFNKDPSSAASGGVGGTTGAAGGSGAPSLGGKSVGTGTMDEAMPVATSKKLMPSPAMTELERARHREEKRKRRELREQRRIAAANEKAQQEQCATQ